MKKLIVISVAFTGLVISVGCGNMNKQSSTDTNYTSENIDTITDGVVNTKPETVTSIDQTAIGNIHMNTDESQFNSEKELFLNEHPKLGGLAISSIKGFFYDNRLAAIEIISDQQDIHSKIINHDLGYDYGWDNLYSSKYKPLEYVEEHKFFSFERAVGRLAIYNNDQFLIEVSDICDSPKGHNSFKDIINSPKKQCYGHNLMPLQFDESSNVARMLSVYTLIDELPKERAKYIKGQYELERSSINTDNLFVKVSSESSIDKKYYYSLLPEVQAQRDRLFRLHRNDPSWSFIIIYYKPLLEKYNHDQEKMKEQRNQEKSQELDII
jgi:hypothetical protein